MTLDEYQSGAILTAKYDDPIYPIASLMVESAELADLFIKPWLRGDDGDPVRKEVLAEAGDVLWNLANLLNDMDITLEEVAVYNIKKVNDRLERGVISGSGGNR
jgi:NTP pyrophosphatase (non-canonical NTP hydrolase)